MFLPHRLEDELSPEVTFKCQPNLAMPSLTTPDIASKCHLFYDIKCALGVLCRLSRQFQKRKDLSQDQGTSDLDYREI